MLKHWEALPDYMQIPEVRPYYDILDKKRGSLLLKRAFDLTAASVLLVALSPVLGLVSLLILGDSPGGVFYRQERVTAAGKRFRLHKFRSMVAGADRKGTAVTVRGDARVTRIGGFLRKYRLDELPQLLDVLAGDMSFVGTRPEVPRYVDRYEPEMLATLLLPAGITSEASIRYKDEAELLSGAGDVDEVYVRQVLPGKMRYNLESLRRFSAMADLRTLGRTVLAVLGKEYGA